MGEAGGGGSWVNNGHISKGLFGRWVVLGETACQSIDESVKYIETTGRSCENENVREQTASILRVPYVFETHVWLSSKVMAPGEMN